VLKRLKKSFFFKVIDQLQSSMKSVVGKTASHQGRRSGSKVSQGRQRSERRNLPEEILP
jgi:hypothetical protein